MRSISLTPFTLTVLPNALAVCRLDSASPVPDWATRSDFFSITRSSDELSIVCDETHAPADVRAERGWRAFKLEGPFAFDAIGVLKQVLDPLAESQVNVFTISTFDTDYVLVKAAQFELAVTALTRFGHTVNISSVDAPEMIEIKCSWRMPNGARTSASYAAEVIEYQAPHDRWLARLAHVRSTDASADATTRALIESHVGKWVFVPSEVRRGLTLPLKYETLTGRLEFFRAEDPRSITYPH
jgi:hypothetical protein